MDGTFVALESGDDWGIVSGTRKLHAVSREVDDDCA
jgi:hypothetical protein